MKKKHTFGLKDQTPDSKEVLDQSQGISNSQMVASLDSRDTFPPGALSNPKISNQEAKQCLTVLYASWNKR